METLRRVAAFDALDFDAVAVTAAGTVASRGRTQQTPMRPERQAEDRAKSVSPYPAPERQPSGYPA